MTECKRVLVVDDTRMIRAMAEGILRNAGYSVYGAASGSEAESIWDEWTPDVVLLDMVLDEETGWDVYDRLRTSSARGAIVFLCTGDEEIDEAKAILRGAAGIIRKPFTAAAVADRITAALATRA